MLHLPSIMSFQQHTGVHYGRGSDAKGMHFYLNIELRELQDQELMIPRNFVERYWKDVSNPISLRLPNEFECKMFWVQRGNDIWLVNWKRFARSLRCGDLLVFQYKGGSDFHVIILDDSKLEIDYSSMRCNDEQDSNKHFKQEEESDYDCVEILSDITTPQGTNIDKKKIIMTSTQQKITGKENKEEGEQQRWTTCLIPTGSRSLRRRRQPPWWPHPFRSPRLLSPSLRTTFLRDQPLSTHTGTNNGSMTKKAMGCSIIGAVNEKSNNVNPSFELKLSQSYAQGHLCWIPTKFSREYLKGFKGIARLRVGEDKAWKVNVKFDYVKRGSILNVGWNLFAKDNNLQVGDVCKFEMTQSEPLSFNISISRVREDPSPYKLQGYEKEISPTNSGGSNVMNLKTFELFVNSSYPFVPDDFFQ